MLFAKFFLFLVKNLNFCIISSVSFLKIKKDAEFFLMRRKCMKKIVLGLGAIVLALSLSACEDLKMAQNAIKQEKSGESGGDSSDSGNNPLDALKKNLSADSGESDDELTQYNNYVDFSNFLTGNFEDNIGRYFEGVEPETEFKVIEGGHYTTVSFSDYDMEQVQSYLDQANAGTNFPDLDEQVKTLAPIVLETMKVYNEAASYGDLQAYKDDQYAKAQEIHSRLFPLVQSYIDPADTYTAAIHSLSVERQQEEMQRMKDNGLTIRYDMLRIMDLKNQIIDAFSEQPNVAEANIADLDLTKIRPAYDELATLLLEFVPLSKDKDAAEKEGFDNNYYVTTFADAAGDFKKQLQEMIDRKESGKGFSENDLQILWATDGSFQKISEAASKMTETYNRAVG
ncbi:hypothetical protein HMPREF6123_1835 [Oribacterium sinus F0268]|uniref:DUF3829 domain-containing protein n=2 Tax=Oribacterium sinus TaxID=237576 RepID=C2KZB6_9FIRM|nr:hypothetical protein HMPREF6123_1835 [Oribacterium sinus F0268]